MSIGGKEKKLKWTGKKRKLYQKQRKITNNEILSAGGGELDRNAP